MKWFLIMALVAASACGADEEAGRSAAPRQAVDEELAGDSQDPVGSRDPATGVVEPSAAPRPVCPPALAADYDRASGWPEDGAQLLAHLNEWDRDELEVAADPDAHPDQMPSGETNGWIAEHLERLRGLGIAVAWSSEQRCYGVVAPAPE